MYSLIAIKKQTKKLLNVVFQRDPFQGLLFLLYINDLQFVSDLLASILFTDDTNLFYSNKNINTVFLKVNNELEKINEWFVSNKFSLNVKSQEIQFLVTMLNVKKTITARFSKNLAKK